jgi:hypothetical protein
MDGPHPPHLLTEEIIRTYFAGEASYVWNCSDIPVPEALFRHGEADLTVAEWLQAWNRLLQLIKEYIPKVPNGDILAMQDDSRRASF